MVPNGVRPPQDPPKAAKADKFFSAQTVPFDLSVDPWWSLMVFGPLGTLLEFMSLTEISPMTIFLGQTHAGLYY